MNNFRRLFFLCITILPVTALATPFQTSPEAEPYVCKSGAAAYDAWKRNHTSYDSAYELITNGTCRKVPGWPEGTHFHVIREFKSDGVFYSQVEIIGEPPSDQPLFISGYLNAPIDPEEMERQRVEAANKYPPGCSMPVGGQVNRMERGKDGQVYLKRYMITTKCVNGQMRSFTTPLD